MNQSSDQNEWGSSEVSNARYRYLEFACDAKIIKFFIYVSEFYSHP